VKFYLHKIKIHKNPIKYLAILMGYNIEISVNILKETKISEIENTIVDNAELYGCESVVLMSEEDGTGKIPRYHMIFVINFFEDNFENFMKFIKFIKEYKKCYIESIYNNSISKLLYASSNYLTNIDKEISNNYRKFINEKKFTPIENILLKEFVK
jgi:hypothetical protein